MCEKLISRSTRGGLESRVGEFARSFYSLLKDETLSFFCVNRWKKRERT